MSVQAMTWVIEHSPHKGSELLCLMMIANHAHADGAGAYPSVSLLARECRMSPRQITRLLHRLEESGAITVQHGAGPRGAHLMTVVMVPDAPQIMDTPLSTPDKMTPRKRTKPAVTPDKMAPPTPDNLTPDKMAGGDKLTAEGVTNSTPGGDIAMSSEPSYRTVKENRQEEHTAARAPSVPYQMLETVCEELGTDPHTLDSGTVSQQCGIAKGIAERGLGVEDVRAYVRYLKTEKQIWRNGLIDMKVIAAGIGPWVMNGRPERAPQRLSSVGRKGEGMDSLAMAARAEQLRAAEAGRGR